MVIISQSKSNLLSESKGVKFGSESRDKEPKQENSDGDTKSLSLINRTEGLRVSLKARSESPGRPGQEQVLVIHYGEPF